MTQLSFVQSHIASYNNKPNYTILVSAGQLFLFVAFSQCERATATFLKTWLVDNFTNLTLLLCKLVSIFGLVGYCRKS